MFSKRGVNPKYHTATHCNTLQHSATICNTASSPRIDDKSIILSSSFSHIVNSLSNSTLQQTTTHCNTLQHTATHCNTLQHTATHCNADSAARASTTRAQHSVNHSRKTSSPPQASHCNTLQHTATHCNIDSYPHNDDETTILRESFSQNVNVLSNITLQHTATHCNTLHLTATHCNTLLALPAYRQKKPNILLRTHPTKDFCERFTSCSATASSRVTASKSLRRNSASIFESEAAFEVKNSQK